MNQIDLSHIEAIAMNTYLNWTQEYRSEEVRELADLIIELVNSIRKGDPFKLSHDILDMTNR